MAPPRRPVIWSPEARADLSEIWGYYAKVGGRNRADNIVRAISDASRLIEDHPLAGRTRDEIRPGLRSIAAHPHVIFYRLRGDVAEIVRILHGKRDLEDILVQHPDEY